MSWNAAFRVLVVVPGGTGDPVASPPFLMTGAEWTAIEAIRRDRPEVLLALSAWIEEASRAGR